MNPDLKAELKRLRKRRFYYLSSRIPEGAWRDGDGKIQAIDLMDIGHLQACIRLIDKDVPSLDANLVSSAARKRLSAQAASKRSELHAVFKRKSLL